jgi:N4-(beta-N-acetylglucosaminyl)-L-asparaginase
MSTRRSFIRNTALSASALLMGKLAEAMPQGRKGQFKPLVISTWDAGIDANKGAWPILKQKGTALDAVEAGVKVTEASTNCCVGLGGRPDRDGHVTLDASIMDDKGRCGSVAALEYIKHPISVARAVMEKTPHVMLVGEGALQFALQQGFQKEWKGLSEESKKEYVKWLKKSEYKPVVNIENTGSKTRPVAVPTKQGNQYNHDTIGMLALDDAGNLSGSCTTSGMAFKLRGRVGDSPIIGAGLMVDNEVGAAVATGVGEEVIRIGGCNLVVEFMRNGDDPETACRKAIERIVKKSPNNVKDMQVAFIAVNKDGSYGAYALQTGFNYAVQVSDESNVLMNAPYYFK